MTLANQIRHFMDLGVYDPDELYNLMKQVHPSRHYASIRKAIHLAKSAIYKEI
jgi:hypothetical protein